MRIDQNPEYSTFDILNAEILIWNLILDQILNNDPDPFKYQIESLFNGTVKIKVSDQTGEFLGYL
jgi:hypothetical protein